MFLNYVFFSYLDKKSVLAGASDDDGEANTYDYDDSFLVKETLTQGQGDSSSQENPLDDEDSEWEPEADDTVQSLVKEAKGFIRNKKMQKPSRNK